MIDFVPVQTVWYGGLMTILIILAVVVTLSGGGTIIASQNALPGDFLYPVKIETEEFRLVLAPDERDAELYLIFANERLEEMNGLLDQGRIEDALLANQRFETQVNAYVVLTNGTANQEQLAALEELQQSYGGVVARVSNAQNLDAAGMAMVQAWLIDGESVTSLLVVGVTNAQNSLNNNGHGPFGDEAPGQSNGAYPAPWTNTPFPTETETEEEPGAYPAPFTATVTPFGPGESQTPTVLPTFTATLWPTFTPTATYYFPPTAVPTQKPTDKPTQAPSHTPTSQPTESGYPAPPTSQPTESGYPAPPTATSQPTESGYPAPPTAQPTSQPTESGYPAPPTATTQPTSQPTQPGYPPPPQPTATPQPQPTEPAYP